MTKAGRICLASLARLADALTDPRRRERAALLALICYAALWTLYGVLAKGSQDLHFDMGELIAWSREPALGYPKHPPLAAWVVTAWFSLFPLADWAYYLLAIVAATLGLWIAWTLSARYLDGEKRAAGLALLTLVPFYNFHALKFNANSVLIPLWAATTWWFLRSFETRSIWFAALAGLGAGAAMLGKYWSIFLIAGLGLAAIVDPRRASYFRSAAPWITIAVGALLLAPHLAWLVGHDFPPFAYARARVAGADFSGTLVANLQYFGGIVGYVAVPVVLALITARPRLAAVDESMRPSIPERRLVAIAFWAPLLLPAAVSLATEARMVSLWVMPAMTLLPVVLLSSPLVIVGRTALVRLLAVAVVLPIAAALAAPIVAIVIDRAGVPHHAAYYRLLAGAIEDAWRVTSDRPLRLVGSDTVLGNSVVPYLLDRPSTLDVFNPVLTPWADRARIASEGIALVCAADETFCVRAIEARAAGAPGTRRTEVELARRHLGMTGARERFLIVTVPPQL